MIEGYCCTAKRAALTIGQEGAFQVPLAHASRGIPMSAAPGDTINFFVRSDAEYTVQYMRLRSRYNSDPKYKRVDPDADTDGEQFDPDTDPTVFPPPASYDASAQPESNTPWEGQGARLGQVGWRQSFSWDVPLNAISGFYAAYCSCSSDGAEFYIPFVVTPAIAPEATFTDATTKYQRFAMLASTLTWNCYNTYGGHCQYTDPENSVMATPPTRANPLRIGFLRPFPSLRPCPPYNPVPPGKGRTWNDALQSLHTLRADLWLFTWLNEHGYEVDLFTDLDFHYQTFNPTDYAGLILGTHPEYWTVAMRDHLDAYLARSGNLIYLGGNGIYERVELDEDVSNDGTWRVSVAGWGAGAPPAPPLGEGRWLWRLPTATGLGRDRPERLVLGVSYTSPSSAAGAYVVEANNASHRLLAKTGLYDPVSGQANTTPFGVTGICMVPAGGWETDTATGNNGSGDQAPDIVVLASVDDNQGAQMTTYDTKSQGLVYAASSINYSQSLIMGDPVLVQILRNVLGECLLASIIRWHPDTLKWTVRIAHQWITPPIPPGPVWPPPPPTPPGPVETERIVQPIIAAIMEHGNVSGIARALRGAGETDTAEMLMLKAPLARTRELRP